MSKTPIKQFDGRGITPPMKNIKFSKTILQAP